MFGKKRECCSCHVSEAVIWKKGDNNSILCPDCFSANKTLPNAIRKSRSSSPDSGNKSMQPRLKIQRVDSDLNDSFSNKEDDKDQTTKKYKDETAPCKDSVSSGKEENASHTSKSKSSKDKSKREDDDKDDNKRETRRKTRKGKQSGKGTIPKGKGRRYIFKKSATKAPVAVSVPVTSESLMYKGQYYQIGDVASVEDVEGGRYYCQIRGLLQDQYCEKSAVVTWLLPTTHSPPPDTTFDPATYIIGPEEELPRKLEHFSFVCHCPSDYYKLSNSPYPTAPTHNTKGGYLWARMGPLQLTKS